MWSSVPAGPFALIDWEFAQPGNRIEDLASAAKHWVPLLSDDRAASEGWAVPVDRTRRLEILCDGYGLEAQDRLGLVPAALANLRCGYRSHQEWGESGVAGFAEMWHAGSGPIIRGDWDWLAAHGIELDGFVPPSFRGGPWFPG